MIRAMRFGWAASILALSLWQSGAHAQCAPAPDSSYFFRGLSEQRAEAKIAANRAFYEDLLTTGFESKGRDGKKLSKHDFIETELGASAAANRRPFFAIREFTLVEHRKDHTVANYLLIEGTTGNGEAHTTETWLREVYEVQDGKWRLASIETVPGK
jgi:hypothetical protein